MSSIFDQEVIQPPVEKRQRIWNDASGSESETNSEDDILPGATPFNGKYEEDEEETQNDIDDFIVEDEDGTGTAGLPAMFSMSSHQDLSHQFKVVCQYFVHLAVTSDRSRKRKADELLEGKGPLDRVCKLLKCLQMITSKSLSR